MTDDKPFNYEFKGRVTLSVSVFRESGESVFELVVTGPKEYGMAIEAILGMGQSFKITSND